MTVKDILRLTAGMVGDRDLYNYLSDLECCEVDQAQQNKQELLICYNAICDELACEYLPLVYSQDFTNVKDNKIYFSALEKTPLKIIEVTNKNGYKCPYKLVNDYISLQETAVTVKYEYKPKWQNENEESLFGKKIIGPFTLCYGVCALYLLQKGRMSESQVFFEKYISAVKARIAEKRKIVIPPRRWN